MYTYIYIDIHIHLNRGTSICLRSCTAGTLALVLLAVGFGKVACPSINHFPVITAPTTLKERSFSQYTSMIYMLVIFGEGLLYGGLAGFIIRGRGLFAIAAGLP